MHERPGPHIGAPQREHQIIAMLWLLSTAESKEEARGFLVSLEAAVEQMWGWHPRRLEIELLQSEQVMKDYQGRMTFWFTDEGMEFDYHCTPPSK